MIPTILSRIHRWDEIGVHGKDPRPSTERSLTLFISVLSPRWRLCAESQEWLICHQNSSCLPILCHSQCLMSFITVDQVTINEQQTLKEQDLTKEKDPPKTSKKKFSPKDLLPSGAGSQSIQKILANFIQVYSTLFYAQFFYFNAVAQTAETAVKWSVTYQTQRVFWICYQLTQKIFEAKRKAFIVIDALNKTDDLGKTGKVRPRCEICSCVCVDVILATLTKHI